MHRSSTLRFGAALLVCAALTAACSSVPPTSTSEASASSGAQTGTPPAPIPGLARLQPAAGAYFGLNLDWGNETAVQAGERFGRTPAVWVQFARFPLDAGARANLDSFIEQVAGVGGLALITLEPHDGLASVTDTAARDLAELLARYRTEHGVRTFVRFAHEMNGSWYPWAQQPSAYIAAFRRVAAAVHARAPESAMIWAPNQGAGYPFSGGRFALAPGPTPSRDLDTDGDGALTGRDDPYAPYYPGDDAVDWVGLSLYHWGLAYPWGENESPKPGTFAAMIRGQDTGAHGQPGAVPDLYATYADGHDKPMAIIETAILYDPTAAAIGPGEAELKSAWFAQVYGEATRDEFPRIAMLNWFEWRKQESEVGRIIDWRLGSDLVLARQLLDGVPEDWLLFGAS